MGDLRIGILGAGYIAEPHAEAIRRLEGAELAAVCDLSRGRAEALALQHGIRGQYNDLEAMLREAKLDALHVLVQPDGHLRLGAKALESGVDVLMEKPVCATSAEARELEAVAKAHGRVVGVSHNFLFFPAYEKLREAVQGGRLGAIDQLDIVWNKELGQVKAGPHGLWMFKEPETVLVEVGPHSFTQLLDLLGTPERMQVSVGDPVKLSTGMTFYRRWEMVGWVGATSVRVRFSFVPGFTEHYIHVRGRSASARCDFDSATYVERSHTPQFLDLDRWSMSLEEAAQTFVGANATFGRYLAGKLGIVKGGKPFNDSIARAVEAFYRTRKTGLDARLGMKLATDAVALAEEVGRLAKIPDEARKREAQPITLPSKVAAGATPKVLVLGATGFIGRALVKKLVAAGHAVRCLVRDTRVVPVELRLPGVELVRGDFTNTDALGPVVEGIETVYHLARSHAMQWSEYQTYDVEGTRRLAELCRTKGVKRFFYTSSIAIYWAGKGAKVIHDDTPPHPSIARANLYARAKVETEKALLAFDEKGLEIAIFRPGVVIGTGGPPLHWGVGAWPYPSVCQLWGDGRHTLPFVLVDDCADALVNALSVPNLHHRMFNLVGDPMLTGHEYLDALEAHSGIRVERVESTALGLTALEYVKFAIKSAGRSKDARRPSWHEWDGRMLAARFDCEAAKRDLGWRPVTDRATFVREGIHTPADEFLS